MVKRRTECILLWQDGQKSNVFRLPRQRSWHFRGPFLLLFLGSSSYLAGRLDYLFIILKMIFTPVILSFGCTHCFVRHVGISLISWNVDKILRVQIIRLVMVINVYENILSLRARPLRTCVLSTSLPELQNPGREFELVVTFFLMIGIRALIIISLNVLSWIFTDSPSPLVEPYKLHA